MSRITLRALAVAAGALMVAGSAAATTGVANAAPANTKKVADATKLFSPDLVAPDVPTPARSAAQGFSAAATRSGEGATKAAPANGSYISYGGKIFRIAGGAPLYVSTWANVPKGPVTVVSTATFNALRWYPADGTFVTATGGQVYRFVAGAPFAVTTWTVYGKAQPTIAIDKNDIVNAGKAYPWDGVLDTTYDVGPSWNPDAGVLDFNGQVFVSTQKGYVYKMVGGTPIYVTTWAGVGGVHTTVRVDQAAIDRAGQALPFAAVRKHLFDQWLIQAGQSGNLFFSAGGSPQYLSNTALLAGANWKASKVDQYAIDRAGSASPNDNLTKYPANGSYLLGVDGPTGTVSYYQVLNGAPIPTTPWDDTFENYTVVDQAVITNAGGASPYNHLAAPPAS